MNKKEQLIEVFNEAVEVFADYVAVAIETRGSKGIEVIINPRENFMDKLEYYKKAYSDDLVLNTFDGIKIISACSFNAENNFEDVRDVLQELF